MTGPGWVVGPSIGRVTLRAVPGLAVVWPVPQIEAHAPAAPVWEVKLRGGETRAFPVVGAAAALTAEDTADLVRGIAARLLDAGAVVLAGEYVAMSGWAAEGLPVAATVQVVPGGVSLVEMSEGIWGMA